MSSESEVYFGFTENGSQQNHRLASTTWVIFTSGGQFLSSRGIFLGNATNNVYEYIVVIELLCDALSHGIYNLRVYLYDQLVVCQLKGVYHVYDPTFHQ
jgi:ribonuclease HI